MTDHTARQRGGACRRRKVGALTPTEFARSPGSAICQCCWPRVRNM